MDCATDVGRAEKMMGGVVVRRILPVAGSRGSVSLNMYEARVTRRFVRSSFIEDTAPPPTNTRLRFVPPELATYSVSLAAAVRENVMPHGCDPTTMPAPSNAPDAPCQTSSRPLFMTDMQTFPQPPPTSTPPIHPPP